MKMTSATFLFLHQLSLFGNILQALIWLLHCSTIEAIIDLFTAIFLPNTPDDATVQVVNTKRHQYLQLIGIHPYLKFSKVYQQLAHDNKQKDCNNN